MSTSVSPSTVDTLVSHGVVAGPKTSQPKPTFTAMVAAIEERDWFFELARDGGGYRCVVAGSAGDSRQGLGGEAIAAMADALAGALEANG